MVNPSPPAPLPASGARGARAGACHTSTRRAAWPMDPRRNETKQVLDTVNSIWSLCANRANHDRQANELDSFWQTDRTRSRRRPENLASIVALSPPTFHNRKT